jgi:hypothetical protein
LNYDRGVISAAAGAIGPSLIAAVTMAVTMAIAMVLA